MKTVLNHKYVFVVLEFGEEPTIHGVYINREEAVAKRTKLYSTYPHYGYIAVLKKSLQGKSCKIKSKVYHKTANMTFMWVEGE